MALSPKETGLLRRAAGLLTDQANSREQEARSIIEGVLQDKERDGIAAVSLEPSSDEDRAAIIRGLTSQLPEELAQKPPGQLTQSERLQLAKRGMALPDGSFPIRSLSDLTEHAMPSYGQAGDKSRAKAWLLKRARELKAGEAIIKRIEGYST